MNYVKQCTAWRMTLASLLALSVVSLSSCSVISSGHYNENKEFVPKNPRFKFKNKAGFVLPKGLSTAGVYQKVASYSRGVQTYPVSPSNKANYTQEDNKSDSYIRFLDNGRYYSFAKAKFPVSPVVDKKRLTKADLNPYNRYYNRGYYFSRGDAQLRTETFVFGDGSGMYVYSDFVVEDGGKTLKRLWEHSMDVYELVDVPESWTQGIQVTW